MALRFVRSFLRGALVMNYYIHYDDKFFALLWFPFQLALELNDAHLQYINICFHSYIDGIW